jgi:hypothetical protein
LDYLKKLRLKNKIVIIFHNELAMLVIDESFKATNVTKFWGIVVL